MSTAPSAHPSLTSGKGHGSHQTPSSSSTSDQDVIRCLPHVSSGSPGDKIMYRDDNNRRVKLDTAGKPYPVGADGWRTGKASGRPAGVDLDVWATLRPILKKEGKTYEQFIAEVSAEKFDDAPAAPSTSVDTQPPAASFTGYRDLRRVCTHHFCL